MNLNIFTNDGRTHIFLDDKEITGFTDYDLCPVDGPLNNSATARLKLTMNVSIDKQGDKNVHQ